MATPVELRIHGVGGSTPEGLLGVPTAADTVRVADGPVSAFHRRRTWGKDQRPVEGYVWGGLTTQSTFQPLWLFLLPLTLHNVAGWMHRSPRLSVLEALIRRTVRVLGWALTAGWTLWIVVLVVQTVAWGLGERWSWALSWRLAAGGVAVLVVLAFFAFLALHLAKDFEYVDPPKGLHARVHGGGDEQRWMNHPEDPDFWRQKEWARYALGEHGAIALITALIGIGYAAHSGLAQGSWPDTGRLLVPVIAFQLAGLAVLAGCSAVEVARELRKGRDGFRDGWRGIGPFAAAATAVGMSYGSFGGSAVFLANWLGLEDAAARPEQVLADVIGLSAIALAIGLAVLLAWHSLPWGKDQVPATPRHRHGTALKGLPNEVWRRRVARRRAFALLLGRMGWAVALPSALFFLFAVAKLWPRPGGRLAGWGELLRGEVTPVACAGGVVRSFWAWLTSACGGPGVAPTWLADAGWWIVGIAITVGVPYLWRAARSPRLRASVGIAWDVLTFLPRWHHPFAVRCYAERAVPEIAHRIVRLDAEGHPVVLSVHSQGTVLAAAAVAALPHRIAQRVALVTFGSPLSSLYARFYPAYFGRESDFGAFVAAADWHVASWTNLYRLTDYVGQTIRGLDMRRQHELDDPSTGPDDGRLRQPAWTDETPRVPWTAIDGHSRYRAEPAVRRAIDAAWKELSALPEDGGPPDRRQPAASSPTVRGR